MTLLLTILLMGLVTYAIRLGPILFFSQREMPDLLLRALRYVPTAVLTAIILPEMLYPGGELALSLLNMRLVAGVAAALVAWRTHNFFLTIAVGMVVLWVGSWVLG
ncbi:MAG: AzlD domain-containing protein [Chloroflexi bacterium]|nr:AzlD domain-containing protein [Chloroflexota bacterium]